MQRVFLTGGSGFIGTNLVARLREAGHTVRSFDLREPRNQAHADCWCRGDLLDRGGLARALSDFGPDWVVHLAARTDCDERTTVEEGYAVNTVGTSNLLEAVGQCPRASRLLVTSSQFVCGPGRIPTSDEDYFPHTVYGRSKVVTEQLTRTADPSCTWAIVRPVNVWGPYHERYCREFWKIASRGLYLHPDVPAPVRTYGYVGNVVWQMLGILEADASAIHRNVFYLGDRPIRIDRWSQGFNRAFRGKDAPRIPLPLMRMLALFGDAVSAATRKPFPLTSNRLHSMTVHYEAPVEPVFQLLGDPPWSLEEGIAATVDWYRRRNAS